MKKLVLSLVISFSTLLGGFAQAGSPAEDGVVAEFVEVNEQYHSDLEILKKYAESEGMEGIEAYEQWAQENRALFAGAGVHEIGVVNIAKLLYKLGKKVGPKVWKALKRISAIGTVADFLYEYGWCAYALGIAAKCSIQGAASLSKAAIVGCFASHAIELKEQCLK